MNSMGAQIWMGSIEPYMNEMFIMNAFQKMGEHPTKVKIMRIKNSSNSDGYYGFVHFNTEEEARLALYRLKGKLIPTTNVRFKLNVYPGNNASDEYALFVGDLSPDVDDYMIFKIFVSRYKSTRSAKVVLDQNNHSKGYAFVKFGNESDQRRCAAEMNGFIGLGSKPIKVGYPTKNKTKDGSISLEAIDTIDNQSNSSDSWNSYTWQPSLFQHQAVLSAYWQQLAASTTFDGRGDMELLPHNRAVNVDTMNLVVLYRDLDFWDAVENSNWTPVEIM